MITRIRSGEGRCAFLFFLHAFLLLASYQMVKALREAFMLAKFSAEVRAYSVALMALVLMFVVPLYSRLRHHVDGARLLRVVTLFFVVTLPLFAVMARNKLPIAVPFFIWVGIFGVMAVAQLWAFASDSFNVKSGQRLFVVVMLGANLGALAGAKATQLVVTALSPMGLMVLAACTLGATLFLAGPERDAVPEGSRALPSEQGHPLPRLFGGIGLVLRDRYLLVIALFVVLLNWINSTGEFILADFVKADAVAQVAAGGGGDISTHITAFYGDFQFWVTVISLGIQLLLVSHVYHFIGVRGALLVQPIIVAIGYGILAFAPLAGGFIPIFSMIRRIKFAENGVDYSLMNTTRQALFLPVDRDSKYDGKTAIDTFFWRFGDLIQAVGVYIGINLMGWKSHQFALLNLGLSLVWIALANVIGRGYARKSQMAVTNNAPEPGDPIPDLLYFPGQPIHHPVSPNAFHDPDPGDVLVLRATCADGRPLPHWLRFKVWQQAFVGKAPLHVEIGELRVTVIASDMDGLRAKSTFVVRRVSVS